MRAFRRLLPTAFLIASLLFPRGVNACTGIRLIATDGTVVRARTLEFGFDLESEIIAIPRNFARTGTTPQGATGLRWKSKYASVGANGVGLPVLFDGVNEKGLAVGLFYFPTTAKYPSFEAAKSAQTLAPWELGSWIVENFDIPKGAARDGERDAKGNITADYTLWTSAVDLQARRFYFRTYENSQIRSVDLMKLPLDGTSITHFAMKGEGSIQSLTP